MKGYRREDERRESRGHTSWQYGDTTTSPAIRAHGRHRPAGLAAVMGVEALAWLERWLCRGGAPITCQEGRRAPLRPRQW